MMRLRLFLVTIITSFLVACGGGGDDATDTSDADASYTGKREQAQIEMENFASFIDIMVRTVDDDSLLLRASAPTTVSTRVDKLQQQEKLFNSMEKIAFNSRFAARTTQETEACSHSGNIKSTLEEDEATFTGSVSLEFIDCRDIETGEDVIVSGKTVISIHEYNTSLEIATSTTLEFHSFTTNSVDGSDKTVLTGNVLRNTDVEAITRTSQSKLFERIITSEIDRQYLYHTRSVYNATSFSISGSLFEGDYGHVKLSTLQPIIYGSYDLPIAGELLLTGANDSKFKMTALGEGIDGNSGQNVAFYQISLDEDGDGSYEQSDTVF